MKIEFDERKNQLNIAKHGFSLNAFELLDFDLAIYEEDERKIIRKPVIIFLLQLKAGFAQQHLHYEIINIV